MNAPILAAVFAPQPETAVAFDTLTLDDASRLKDKRVAFEVGRPAYAWALSSGTRYAGPRKCPSTTPNGRRFFAATDWQTPARGKR